MNTPETLKLEAGKRYVTRDGRVTGPLKSRFDPMYEFECNVLRYDWTSTGAFNSKSKDTDRDLVSEYVEAPTIPGLPEGLPVPPDAPEGHYGVYRGMGWESPIEVLYSSLHINLPDWRTSSSPSLTRGYPEQHYIEWVPIKEQAAEPASVPPVGVAREWDMWINPCNGGHTVHAHEGWHQIRVREILPESGQAEEAWKGIETLDMPDKTSFLVYCSKFRNIYVVTLKEGIFYHFGLGSRGEMQESPTHWQPLPEPPKLTPPTPDFSWSALWDELPSWINWVAMDYDGEWVAFKSRPSRHSESWIDILSKASRFPLEDVPPAATDWTTSLVERPGK